MTHCIVVDGSNPPRAPLGFTQVEMRHSLLPFALAASLVVFGCDDSEGDPSAGGSGGSPGTGGVGGNPGAGGVAGEGGADAFSLSDLRFYIPVSAAAVVNTDQTYHFPMGYSSAFSAPLNLCTLNVVADAGTLVGNFQITLPRGADDSFSFQYQFFDDGTPDFVSWGLSDQSSGDRWVSVPDGAVDSTCSEQDSSEAPTVKCSFIWFGKANRETNPEEDNVPASVNVDCLFLETGVAQYSCLLSDCAPDNVCAVGVCAPDLSCGEVAIRDGFPCDLDDGPGVCDDGTCVESPCGMPCTADQPETISFCNLFDECCDTDPGRFGCQ